MNKVWAVVMFLVLPLIFTLQVNAQVVSSEVAKAEVLKEPRFSASLGLGSSYGFEEEKLGKLKKYSNAFTSSLRLGYSLSKYVEVQGEYSRASKFEAAHDYGSYYLKTSFAFSAFTFNIKAGTPVRIKKINFYPYVVLGAGKANVDYSVLYKSTTMSVGSDKNSPHSCSKKGIGVEVNLHKNIYLFSELNNWKVKWENIGSEQGYVFHYQQIITGLTLKFSTK